MNNETQAHWIDIAYKAVIIIPVFVLLWKFIDKYFKDKSEERAGFIKSVVSEAMAIAIQPLERQIKDLSDRGESQINRVNARIDELFKDNRKL